MMHAREGGYIGGDLSYQERYERYIKPILSELPRTDSYNPADQCRCGTTARVRYRGRWYCPRCGRRSTPKAVQAVADAFDAAMREATTDSAPSRTWRPEDGAQEGSVVWHGPSDNPSGDAESPDTGGHG